MRKITTSALLILLLVAGCGGPSEPTISGYTADGLAKKIAPELQKQMDEQMRDPESRELFPDAKADVHGLACFIKSPERAVCVADMKIVGTEGVVDGEQKMNVEVRRDGDGIRWEAL